MSPRDHVTIDNNPSCAASVLFAARIDEHA